MQNTLLPPESPHAAQWESQPASKRLKPEYPKCPNVYLRKLRDELQMSFDKIGELIGSSGGTAHKHYHDDMAAIPYERAAELAYIKATEKKQSMLFAKVDNNTLLVLEPWLLKNKIVYQILIAGES